MKKKYWKYLLYFSFVVALVIDVGTTTAVANDNKAKITTEVTWQQNDLCQNAIVEPLETEVTVVSQSLDVSAYISEEEAVLVLREAMVARESNVTLYMKWELIENEAQLSEITKSLFSRAIEHTGNPKEGDYLQFHSAGWGASASCDVMDGNGYYTITYNLSYYTTAEQEEKVDEALELVLEEIKNNKTDIDKIVAVYDFVCNNVIYDYENLDDDSHLLKYTAYAALIDKSAVCQGYSNLCYRMFLELGIDSRIIAGTSEGEAHTWNIVHLGDIYYNIDATWDAAKAHEDDEYQYFLKNSDEFDSSHTRNPQWTEESFVSTHPVSAESYVFGSVPRFDTIEAAAEYLRDGYINWSFESSSEYGQFAWVEIPAQSMTKEELSDAFWNAISTHTGNPQGGDYMKYNASAYVQDIVKGDVYWNVKVAYAWKFTHEENTQLNLAISNLLKELNLDNLSDYEKVRAIYDWMCLNIDYDYTFEDSTAYDALCKRRVLCQGYASLFYRLCLEAGVDCRYCGGYASFGAHGWNLVKIEGDYYFVDVTWGAAGDEIGVPDYFYFLKGINGMDDHLVVQGRWEQEIGDYCTPAEKDYPIPEKEAIFLQGEVGNIKYTLNRVGELTLEGEGEILAEEWQDLVLSSVAVFWTDDLGTNLSTSFPTRSIKIGEGITKIEAGALSLSGVIRAELPESLTYLGKDNFENVVNLHISKNLTTIEYGAIHSTRLNRLTVDPENPSYSAMDNCLYTKDKKILLCYGGLTEELEGCTFGGGFLTSFTVPEGVVEIAPEAFYNQDILTFISLPGTVQVIGESAFYQCIPVDFENAVARAKTLTVQMSDGVVLIEKEAFLDSAIKEIYIGKNVMYIGEMALGSSYLEIIEVHPENANYCTVEGVLFDVSKETLIRYPVVNEATTYVVPDGVKEISAGAFDGFYSSLVKGANLVNVEFPESLEIIGNYAFRGQIHLEDIGYASGLRVIGEQAFVNCSSLEIISIPDGVERVEACAFMNNKSNKIHIGMDVNFIGMGAFQRRELPAENAAVYEVYFHGEPPETVETGRDYIPFGYFEMYGQSSGFVEKVHTKLYFPVEEHAAWNPYGNNQWIYDPGWDYTVRNLKYPIAAYHIGNDETIHIFESEMDGSQIKYICTQCDITHVFDVEEDPDKQEVDPGLIFEEAYGYLHITAYEGSAQELIIPEEVDGKVVSQINEGAFRNCDSLERVIISDTITMIWNEAFEGCDNLKYVDVSKSVTWIGNRVFDNCPELLTINVHTDNTVYFNDSCGVLYKKEEDKILLIRAPEALSGEYKILDGTWLIMDNSFKNCRGVSSVLIPEGVVEIASAAFENSGITVITIPSTVTYLGGYLFAVSGLDEVNVKEVIFQGDAPSVIGEYAFRFVEGLTVYYPADNVTWTADVMQDYGGSVIWKPYGSGVTVSGTVTSYNDSAGEVTVELLDSTGTVAYSTTVTGNSASYTLSNVAAGTYTMNISKANHVTRSYTVVVETADLTQDAKICLRGDVTGDGKITATDYSRLLAHVKKTNVITDEYTLLCADVTGEGKITATDYSRLLAHVKKVSLLW